MADPYQDTVEFSATALFAETFFSPNVPGPRWTFGGASHQGYVRPNNEDQFAIVKRRRSSEVLLTSLDSDEITTTDDVAYGLVVADGIGGADYGEVASRLAVQSMLELSGQATSWLMKLTDPAAQQVEQRVDAYVQRIQESLQRSVEADPRLKGMGTTWTSAHLLGRNVVIVHVGDSRAYLVRERQIVQLTRDETMAQALIEEGMEPRSVNRFRHVLLNSLGATEKVVVTKIYQVEIEPGDQLLLCTDGLHGLLSDDDILQVLQGTGTPQSNCDVLVEKALAAGGHDNVTVVLAAAAPDLQSERPAQA